MTDSSLDGAKMPYSITSGRCAHDRRIIAIKRIEKEKILKKNDFKKFITDYGPATQRTYFLAGETITHSAGVSLIQGFPPELGGPW